MTASAPQDSNRPQHVRADLWHPVLIALVAVTVLVEAVLLLADHGVIGSVRWRPLAYQYGGFWAGLLHGWTPNYAVQPVTMFVSYAFLHVGPEHLIGNMLALLGLSPLVIDRFGIRGFCIIYFGAMLGGGVSFGLLSHSPSPMVGASGALSGMMGAWIWGMISDRRKAGQSLWPILAAVVGLALLNAAMWAFFGGLLAWETHLGGFVTGLGVATILPDAGARSKPEAVI